MTFGITEQSFISLMVITLVINVLTGKIFNFIPIAIVSSYIVVSLLNTTEFVTIILHLITGIVVMAIIAIASHKFDGANILPFGVIKLIGAIIPWVGLGEPLFNFLLFSTVLIYLTIRFQIYKAKKIDWMSIHNNVPYAPSIVLAALYSTPLTTLWIESLFIGR